VPYIKLREYNGRGKFEFKMSEPLVIETDFKLYFLSNAKAVVEISYFLSPANINIISENQKGLFDVSLNGKVTDPQGFIYIEKMVINSINISGEKGKIITFRLELYCDSSVDITFSNETFENVQVHYGLTNFLFSGCAYTTVGDTFLLDKFNAKINGLNFLFKKVKDYKEVENRLKSFKGCLLTSEVIVEVSNNEIDTTNSMIFNIIELLSLATRNFVSPIYEDHFHDGKLIKTILNNVLTMNYRPADDLIDSRRPVPCLMQIFLETTYDKYQEFKDVLGLNNIIHLYLISRFALFTESKFLLAIVSLESLSSYFEDFLKSKGETIIPSSIGRTRKDITKILDKHGIKIEQDVLEEIVSSVAYSNTSFNDRLIPLLKTFDVKYKQEDLELIQLRNKIVHIGKFPEKLNSRAIDSYKEEIRSVYFLDRILLSILGYKNQPFLNIMNKYNEEMLQ
jgi:hypothetical protein